MKNEIVSVEWLKHNSMKNSIVILDSSPISTVKGKTSKHSGEYIPNARIVNIQENFIEKNSNFPNTIPSPSQFEVECRLLGINSDSEIVIYDNLGIYSSPRIWWLFKTMGHENVKVLDGGLIEWKKQGYETVNKSELPKVDKQGNFKSNFQSEKLITYKNIIENIEREEFLVADARSKGRFEGVEKEPRKHLKSGNIPGSINIPYHEVLDNKKYKSKEELKQIFQSKIKKTDKIVFSCGSGMTACIVMLACQIAFKTSNYLYDGSWTEYAERTKI